MDELVTQFASITGASAEKAQQYLNISEYNLEQAIELYFNTGGVDLFENADTSGATSNPPPPIPQETRPDNQNELINLDSEDEDLDEDAAAPYIARSHPAAPSSASQLPSNTESDEAMARRLQEEMYAGGDVPGLAGAIDADGYRAPIARTRETLVGPEPLDPSDPDAMRAAIAEQMASRRRM